MSVISKKETETETKTVFFSSMEQDNRASALANLIGMKLQPDLEVLARAKQDWEGGPFRVMFTLIDAMPAEQLNGLPDTKAETGNNPRWYKVRIKNAEGKETTKEHDFYAVLAECLPGVLAKKSRVDMLGRSMKDPTKYNITDVPQDVKDMPLHRRHAEISRLNGEVSTAKTAVIKAFELFWQFKRFEELSGVEASMIWALGDDGQELKGTVENTKTPIVISTKLESRRAIDVMRIGIGAFLKFDVAKAMEQGGSYQALEATVKKGTKNKDEGAASNSRNVNTIETAQTVVNDLAEYLVRIQDAKDNAAWEALNKAAHGAGSDDFFQNLCWIKASLELIVGNPRDQVRFQALINKSEEAAA